MIKLCRIVVLAMLALLAAVPARAQLAADTRQERGDGARNQNIYRGSKIIGAPIRDPRNNKLGVIKDIVLGSDRGEIAYVIATFQGVTGSGNKYHPIPWKALRASDNGQYYILNADRETTLGSPSFDRGKWPDMADQHWNAEVTRYWDRTVGNASSGGISPRSGANTATGTR